jgi:hypothetical protein
MIKYGWQVYPNPTGVNRSTRIEKKTLPFLLYTIKTTLIPPHSSQTLFHHFRRFVGIAYENRKVSWTVLLLFISWWWQKLLLCLLTVVCFLIAEFQFAVWISMQLSCRVKLIGLWMYYILAFCFGCICCISCQIYYPAWSKSMGKYLILLIGL